MNADHVGNLIRLFWRLKDADAKDLLAITYAETRTRLEPHRFHTPVSLTNNGGAFSGKS